MFGPYANAVAALVAASEAARPVEPVVVSFGPSTGPAWGVVRMADNLDANRPDVDRNVGAAFRCRP
jgi:hypothetical protein